MNLRHACAYKASLARGAPATWWAFAAAFADECTMAGGNYNHECAEAILERLGFDGRALNAMDLCVGDTHADKPNELMEAEQALQADADGTGAGSVIMMPTVRGLVCCVRFATSHSCCFPVFRCFSLRTHRLSSTPCSTAGGWMHRPCCAPSAPASSQAPSRARASPRRWR
jgi:hypothetical protein